MHKIVCLGIIWSLTLSSVTYAQADRSKLELNELVLPTDVTNLQKKTGSIYYSKSVKNTVLVPANFWGEVRTAGLHFIPEGTSLIKGLSLAGGPTGQADIEDVQVTREVNGETIRVEFDLSGGGEMDAHNFKLQHGDVVFVEKDHFQDNRIFYTALISVLATLVSTVTIFKQND